MPSLQSIQDAYEEQGLRGEALRKALASDAEYQRLLAEKHAALLRASDIAPEDAVRYVIATDRDVEILGKIRTLEALPLSEHDARAVRLIRAQLEQDWRTALLAELDAMLTRYQ